MRVGIIGYGGWGAIHAAAVDQLERHELVAIACATERSADRARSDHPGVQVCTDYRRLLELPDVEAVHVVVPSYLHVEVASAALDAGKHVVMEKPMAVSLEEADRFVEHVRRSGRVVTLVHELRVSEQWGEVRRLIERGDIGEPRYALLNLFRFPYRQGSSGWRYRPEQVGSWVLEEPIHFIDLLLWYFEPLGPPREVSAYANPGHGGLSRDFTAVFRFANGAHGVVSQTLSAFEHHQTIEIAGTDGAIRSLWSGAMDRTDRPEFSLAIQKGAGEPPRHMEFTQRSGELFEIVTYLGQALDGIAEGKALYPVQQERELIRLCLAAEESARTGTPVGLE